MNILSLNPANSYLVTCFPLTQRFWKRDIGIPNRKVLSLEKTNCSQSIIIGLPATITGR